MSKISSVCGKSRIFIIEGIEIEMKANYLTIDDLPSLMALSSGKEETTPEEMQRKGKILSEFIPRILKKSIPDASDEEIKEFALRNLKSLTEAIVEISGLNVTSS